MSGQKESAIFQKEKREKQTNKKKTGLKRGRGWEEGEGARLCQTQRKCSFLFASLNDLNLLKGILLLKDRILSKGSKFLPFRVDSI